MNNSLTDREVCEHATRWEPDSIRELTLRFSALLLSSVSRTVSGWRVNIDELWSRVVVSFATGYLESCDGGSRQLDDYVYSLAVPDLMLATACLLGDESASRSILQLVETRVRPSLLRNWGGRTPRQQVEDVIQDIVSHCVACKGRESSMATSRLAAYRGKAALSTWLYAIVVRQLTDLLRSRHASRSGSISSESVPASAVDRPDLQVQAAEDDDRGRMHRDRLIIVLQDAFALMPPRRRLAAVLRWVRGYRPNEVADRMRVSRPRVTELLTEADRDLRNAARPVCTQIAMELDKPVAEIENILSEQLQDLLNRNESSTDGEILTINSPKPPTSNQS